MSGHLGHHHNKMENRRDNGNLDRLGHHAELQRNCHLDFKSQRQNVSSSEVLRERAEPTRHAHVDRSE